MDKDDLDNQTKFLCESLRDLLAKSLDKSLLDYYQDYLVDGIVDIRLKGINCGK